MKHGSVLLVACGAMILGGCVGTIRMVKKTQTGGVIAIAGLREDAMKKATAAMAQHCGGAYTVVEEGEIVVGTSTQSGESTNYGSNKTGTQASTSSRSSSTTRDATEYRITYVCGTQAPPSADPTAVAPTPPTS